MRQSGNLVFLDIETYYDAKIELGFKHQTTEEYIRDPRAEMIGFGYKINKEPTRWCSGDNRMMHATLRSLNLERQIVVCHNAPWDLGFLKHHYDVTAGRRICTLMMAAVAGLRPVLGGSLAKLGEALGIGTKGHEVVLAEGKRRQDFTPEELARYGEYCCNDVEMTANLFYRLAPLVGAKHMHLIDATVRMFSESQLELDRPLLENRLRVVRETKATTLARLADDMGVTVDRVGEMLRSNPQFASLLIANGIEPGKKITPGEQKKADLAGRDPVPTYAFAKTDAFMDELLFHERPEIVVLAEARLGEKSAGEESRLIRFVGIAERGALPVPLSVAAAHTGRYATSDASDAGGGAGERSNLMNLPKRSGRDTTLRESILAPKGKVIVAADSSAIELRIGAYICQQLDMLHLFRTGQDPYSHMAASLYKRDADVIRAEAKAGVEPGKAQRAEGKEVHLSGIFGIGHVRYRERRRQMGTHMTVEQAMSTIYGYRKQQHAIVSTWDHIRAVVLPAMVARSTGSFGGPDRKLIKYGAAVMAGTESLSPYIELPDGFRVYYHKLSSSPGEFGMQYTFLRGKQIEFTHAARILENATQGLAFAVLGEQGLAINKRYPLCLNVHDEWSTVVPEEEAEAALAFMIEQMSIAPPYLDDCPLSAEGGYNRSYGRT